MTSRVGVADPNQTNRLNMSTLLLKGGLLTDGTGQRRADILVRDGRIAAISPDIVFASGAEVLDCSGKWISEGFTDIHVHFREPGQSYKETIRTGSLAAAHGGYTTVCAMPNLNPVPDSPETLALEQEIIDRDACIRVLPYAAITRDWQAGDKLTVALDPQLRYETCPNYEDYIAFKYGPILLASPTSKPYDVLYDIVEGAVIPPYDIIYLPTEILQNEYAGAGRMDHAPGSMALSKSLIEAPMLIGNRADVLSLIERKPSAQLAFTIDASRPDAASYQWTTLELVPFHQIHHARYMCYWYQQTADNYANSTMAKTEAEAEALAERTIDFVSPGEQQSEAGHEYDYSSDSSTGTYNTEHYRDARANGHIQYTLFNPTQESEGLSILFRFNLADRGRKATLTVDGVTLADFTVPASAKNSDANGFFNIEYPLPSFVRDAEGLVKTHFVVRLTASSTTLCPGIYGVRLMKDYEYNTYRFVPSEWTTGDAGRVSASNITPDDAQGVLHVKASGQNNVCLMLKYQDTDYTIDKSQKYLVVRGTGLNTASGTYSYLWWLNGSNHGTQVQPAQTTTVTIDGIQQKVIAWDMSTSGLYENFSGDRPNVCVGQTIFGVTSQSGQADIYDVNFAASVSEYVETTTAVRPVATAAAPKGKARTAAYDLSGRRTEADSHGIYIRNGKTIIR